MKILIIGDIHGRTNWKSHIDDSHDKIIFVGDYVDSFDITGVEQKKNLEDIISFKLENFDRVELLIGNHDFSYMTMGTMTCSGYQPEMLHDFYSLFTTESPNEEHNRYRRFPLFNVAYQIDNHLFTHAGVHVGWYNFYATNAVFKQAEDGLRPILRDLENDGIISEYLNDIFNSGSFDNIFDMIGWMRGGCSRIGSCIWVDIEHSRKKPLKGYHQYVGHTKTDEIKKYERHGGETSITFLDTLEEDLTLTIEI